MSVALAMSAGGQQEARHLRMNRLAIAVCVKAPEHLGVFGLVLLNERNRLVTKLPVPGVLPRVIEHFHTLCLELQAETKINLLALGEYHKAGRDTRQGSAGDADELRDLVRRVVAQLSTMSDKGLELVVVRLVRGEELRARKLGKPYE